MIWKVLLDQEIQCVSRFGNQIIIEEILFGRTFVKKDSRKKKVQIFAKWLSELGNQLLFMTFD